MKRGLLIVLVFTIASAACAAETVGANQFLIWGIGSDQIAIPSGSIITEAVLTIEGLSEANQPFFVHLLDNTQKGLTIAADNCVCNLFETHGIPLQGAFENGNYVCRFSANDNPQSSVNTVFGGSPQVLLADASLVTLSSAVLELMDYAGNGGGFGIGIDTVDRSITISCIQLQLTLKSYVNKAMDSKLTYSYGIPGLVYHRAWDFQNNSLFGWQVVDEGTVEGPSRWECLYGQLVQSSNIYSVGDVTNTSRKGTYLVYTGGFGLTNYQVEFDMLSVDDDSVGVMFRYRDPNNYYRFSWDKQRSIRRLVKNVNGVFTVLAEDYLPYIQRENYRIAVRASGTAMIVYVNGQQVFSVADASLASGTIAMYSWANAGAFFDNILISELRR